MEPIAREPNPVHSSRSRNRPDGLDREGRRRENLSTALFLVAFLLFCGAAAMLRFAFFMWTIELACGVIYVAIFMFALSIRGQTPDSSSIYWGIGFLFTFVFDVVAGYTTIRSASPDFRLGPPGLFLWISTQWFQAYAILIVLSRRHPRMSLPIVALIYSLVAATLLSIHLFLPGVELLLVSRFLRVYLWASSLGLAALYAFMLIKLLRSWSEEPLYFARLSLGSIIASGIASAGIILSLDSGTVPVFIFNFVRFVALALCYNANVTFTVVSPLRSLFGQLSERADQLSAANSRLEEALAEKEVLLGEIHHRVKNNLQVVSSLLSLQAHGHEDSTFRLAIETSQNRIRAMAMVHEMLYQNRDFAALDFTDYIRRLAEELFSSAGRSGIRLELRCEQVHVPIDAAISCGLITNELITNSLKHAFPEGRAGMLRVGLRSLPGRAELVIEDDGVGLPAAFDPDALDSLGLSLLASLCRQLGGEYSLESRSGTRFELSFPNGARGPNQSSEPSSTSSPS